MAELTWYAAASPETTWSIARRRVSGSSLRWEGIPQTDHLSSAQVG